jgi:hypothetical protein
MTPLPLGILALAGAGGAGTGFDLLETTTLNSNSATVIFDSLGTYSNYKHLQIRIAAKSTGVSWGFIRANGDTASSYSRHVLEGNGSSASSSGSPNYTEYLFGVSGTDWGASVIDILDAFDPNKFTTFRALSGWIGAGGIQLTSGNWRNTNALTSILLDLQNDSWSQSSRFSLYGRA